MKMTLLLFLLSISFAHAGPKACGGAQVGYWTNSDGSRGGMVASTAKAFAGAFIAPEAQVCEFAQIHKDAKLLDRAVLAGRAQLLAGGEVSGSAKVEGEARVGGNANIPTKITGEVVIAGNPHITGRTNISQKAKVSGSAKIHNSLICQASLIEGIEVIESDYYCQTDDPEPPHPGEAGTKTLLGVDVDRDGVRDDIEIWINQKFSNTPTKDYRQIRLEFKLFASKVQEEMKFHKYKAKFIEISDTTLDSVICLGDSIPEFSKVLNEYQAEVMNTSERYNAYMKAQKFLAGRSSGDKLKKGYKACFY